MKTDRELLELAAKAYWGEEIGDICSIEWSEADQAIAYTHGENQDHNGRDCTFIWNPLADDGDTFRLEADMSFSVVVWADGVEVGEFVFKAGRFCSDPKRSSYVTFDECGGDRRAARRLAGVRAAAAIGESMP